MSNGNIHFQTEDVAISYIRHRLLDSLNRPIKQQFERGITKRGTLLVLKALNGQADIGKIIELTNTDYPDGMVLFPEK